MRNNKLIVVLKKLDARSRSIILKYLMKVFPSKTQSGKLVRYLFKLRNDLNSNKLDNKILKKKLGLEHSHKRRFNNIQLSIVSEIESYFIKEELGEDQFTRRNLLMRKYEKLGLSNFFYKESDKMLDYLEKYPEQHMWNALLKKELYSLRYNYEFSSKYDTKSEDFDQMVHNSFLHNEQTKLFAELEHLSRQKIVNVGKSFVNELIHEQDVKNQIEGDTLIIIYRNLLNLLKHGTKSHYTLVKKDLMTRSRKLNSRHRLYILIHLINYSVRGAKSGEFNYCDELKELFGYGLKEQILFTHNKISHKRFCNIVDTMAKFEELEWSRKFIKKWSKNLDPKYRLETIGLAESTIHFAEGKYSEVLDKLSRISLLTLDHKLRARWLKICSLYESFHHFPEGRDIIISYIKSTKQFLRNNKRILDKGSLEGSINLVWFIGKLMGASKNNIEIKIENKPIVFGLWVRQKIEELKSKTPILHD